MKTGDIWKLVVSIIACLAAGAIGSIFTRQAIPTWYATLEKPAFNPPNWLFAPVWTLLYIMMGVAAFLVWRKGLENRQVRTALIVFLCAVGFKCLVVGCIFRSRVSSVRSGCNRSSVGGDTVYRFEVLQDIFGC
jgi:tryptophan-rich sensory protein